MTANYNLYDGRASFRLRFLRDGMIRDINEPVGVREMLLVLPRDKNYFGFSAEFIKTGTTLGFDAECGRDEIKREWELCGIDAAVEFTFTIDDETIFTGSLKFATYSDDGEVVSIEIERTSFEELFRTRFDTVIDLLADKTIDETPISRLESKRITLHSKRIKKEFLTDLLDAEDVQKEFETEALVINNITISLPTETVKINEFGDRFWKGTAAGASSDNYLVFYNNLDYQFLAVEAGTYGIAWKTRMDLHVQNYTAGHWNQATDIGQARIWAFVFKGAADATGMQTGNLIILKDELLYDGTVNSPEHTYPLEIDINDDTRLEANERVYAFILFFYMTNEATKEIEVSYTIESLSFAVSSLTERPASECDAFDLVAAFEQCVRIATNRTGTVLKSAFLDSIRGKYMIANGLRLRRFSQDRFSAVNTNLKTFMRLFNTIWALGYCFAEANENTLVRIEPVMRFFNPAHCAHEIEEAFDYSETTAKDLLFNELETGYEKYAESEYGSIDEFNNRREYLLPIKRFKGKLTKKTDVIASGYQIELTRALQFEETSKESDTNDDNLFIFTMSDRNRNECERNEPFAVCEGTLDPTSIYNARISPARIALAWMPFVNSVCFHKTAADMMRCQFWTQNGGFKTRLPVEGTAVVENMSFPVVEPKKFIPTLVKFKTPMYAAKFLELRKSLLLLLDDTKNNGYVRFFDTTGTPKTGWVMNLEYDAYRELASLELLLRNDKHSSPDAEIVTEPENT